MPEKFRSFFLEHLRLITADEAITLYRWLSVPRFAATLASGGAVALFWVMQSVNFDFRPVLLLLLPAFVITSVTIDQLIRRKIMPVALLHAQLLIDLLAVTFGVLLTGGTHSPFAGLYILVIISSSLVSVPTLAMVGVGTGLLYEAMAWAERTGAFPSYADLWTNNGQNDAVTIAVFGLVTALIAFQSSYYVSHIRRKDEEILKLKDEMLFRTVHDLRSPSAVIRFVVEKYREEAKKRKMPEMRDDMGLVNTALGRMSMLIDDVLKMAQGERPDFVVKADPVGLVDVVRGAAKELAPVMDAKEVRFVYKPPKKLPMVRGDAEKLKEVFSNFFDNAVKYNREGGDISVTHHVEGRRLLTEVTDTGIGISEKSMAKLFTPYFRGDVGRDIPGTGLGLYMTKKLIEKMGGEVSVRSTQGIGTTFTIALILAH